MILHSIARPVGGLSHRETPRLDAPPKKLEAMQNSDYGSVGNHGGSRGGMEPARMYLVNDVRKWPSMKMEPPNQKL